MLKKTNCVLFTFHMGMNEEVVALTTHAKEIHSERWKAVFTVGSSALQIGFFFSWKEILPTQDRQAGTDPKVWRSLLLCFQPSFRCLNIGTGMSTTLSR